MSTTLVLRVGMALEHARKAARWNSSKAHTTEDAARFHLGLIFVIAVLEGELDELIDGLDEREPLDRGVVPRTHTREDA